MKILYIVPVIYQGGAERIVLNLAEYMQSQKNEVLIVALKGPLKIDNNSLNIKVLNLKSLLNLPFTFLGLLRIYYNFKPDLVHSHVFYSHFMARIIKFFLPNHILLCSEHCTLKNIKYPFFNKIFLRITNFLVNKNYNVSKEGTESYIEEKIFKKNEIETIYNGIDINRFSSVKLEKKFYLDQFNIDDKATIFLCVGRLHYQKDYPTLFYSLSILKKKYNLIFKCLIVGEGEDYEKLKKIVFELNLNNEIVFLGIRDDIPQLMKLCDLYILPSLFEGLPTVLIEALAASCLIVSTDCGGAKEILGNITDVVPTQTPNLLAEKIYSTLNLSNDEINIVKKLSFERAKNLFSLEKMNSNWLKEYNSKFEGIE